jgi:hypothetical protein
LATNAYGSTPTVTAINEDLSATNTLIVDGTPVAGVLASGTPSAPLTLAPGAHMVQVQVVAHDGVTTNLYTVNVTQLGSSSSTNAYLTSLVVSPNVGFAPGFTTNGYFYYATNSAGQSPTVTVTNGNLSATNTLIVNGSAVSLTNGIPSAPLTLGVGGTNVVQVQVVAQDGVTTNIYTVDVTLLPPLSTNAYLTSLVVSPGVYTPVFATNGYSYAQTNYLPNSAVTVTVTNADLTATNTLYYGGVSQGALLSGAASGSLSLSQGVTNVVQVQVVAQDGVTTNLYTVNVTLQPSQTACKLTNSVSGGTTLVLSWPADHVGYRLLTQTNNLNKGVSKVASDWGPYNGGYNTTNGANIPIIKTGVTNQYYRLTYP